MISNVIDLTLALSKAGERAVLVTKDDSVIETLRTHGKEIASKTGVKHLRVQKDDPEGFRKSYSVNYDGIEEKYGDKAVMIIGKITTLSTESIKNSLSQGALKIEVEGSEYEIEESLLTPEMKKPAGSEVIEFSKGYLYIEPKIASELDEDVEKEVQEEERKAVEDMPKPEEKEDDVSEEHDI